jgi:imidazole glycerol-phosphate synthase subunit HisH
MTNPKIAIIDYGVGNLHSIVRAFNHFGEEPIITEDVDTLKSADAVVLPGVGSFEAGMRGLEVRGLVDTVKEIAESGKPMLGICLGAQLLLSEGHEFGVFQGLGVIPGKVVHFPTLAENEKVPHIGWNNIFPHRSSWQGTILDSTGKDDQVYFVHSFILEPESEENIFALTEYGGHKFCSAVKKGNIYGCQFHPEKSGQVGLKIFDNFIKLVRNNTKSDA